MRTSGSATNALLLLLSLDCGGADSFLSPPRLVLPLDHRAHRVSASRWGGNHTDVVQRRLEAAARWQEWQQHRRRRRLDVVAGNGRVSEAPLFEGIGTHYAHIYVGTPPQRVSVIVDTGSHHTAFPCTGCSNCGKHTDPYFAPAKSSTVHAVSCSQCKAGARCVSKKCQFSQSYTEGSSWKAYQMLDDFWVGGQQATSEPAATLGRRLSTPFMFGCQFSETGLFRTQKADGIMGLSANPVTLVPHLKSQSIIDQRAFSLCFKKGGGRFTIGGVDTTPHQESMKFVPLTKTAGWFTVHLKAVKIGERELRVRSSVLNSGKGVIVDSGTTDTYLPRGIASAFKQAWKAQTGRTYANSKMTLSPEQFRALPTVSFLFDGQDGQQVEVHMRPDAYMEKVRNQHVPRIYLTEGSGAVLGANFMHDHDVLFDSDHKRVGFARSDCSYNVGGGSGLVTANMSAESVTVESPQARVEQATAPPARFSQTKVAVNSGVQPTLFDDGAGEATGVQSNRPSSSLVLFLVILGAAAAVVLHLKWNHHSGRRNGGDHKRAGVELMHAGSAVVEGP